MSPALLLNGWQRARGDFIYAEVLNHSSWLCALEVLISYVKYKISVTWCCVPAQCVPAQCAPAQCVPAQCAPAQCVPAQCVPAQCVPAQCAPEHIVSVITDLLSHAAKTQYQIFDTNIPRKGTARHSPNSYIHVPLSDLHIPWSVCLFCCRKIGGPNVGI